MDYQKLLEELERYSNADGYQYTLECRAAEAIRTLLEENKRVWKSAKSELPERAGVYLCAVEIPEDGGLTVARELRRLTWQLCLEYPRCNAWSCQGMIVTHWMPLPELPEA